MGSEPADARLRDGPQWTSRDLASVCRRLFASDRHGTRLSGGDDAVAVVSHPFTGRRPRDLWPHRSLGYRGIVQLPHLDIVGFGRRSGAGDERYDLERVHRLLVA